MKRQASHVVLHLYLDQNYLSGIAKAKPAFVDLKPVLREAVSSERVRVLESDVHARESEPRPDLQLMALLKELTRGARLRADPHETEEVRRRMRWTITNELPERHARGSDEADLEAIAQAIVACDLVATDSFMADVVKRARLDLRHRVDVFGGRRIDVERLTKALSS